MSILVKLKATSQLFFRRRQCYRPSNDRAPALRARPMTTGVRVNAQVAIPLDEIELTFARAGGPGGQNVNKVASKAVLRFNVQRSPSLPEALRQRLLNKLASRLTRDGDLIIAASTYRDQPRNRTAAFERLRMLLAEAAVPPKRRVKTRPSAGAKERRLESKKARGRIKRLRATHTTD